MPMHIPNPPRSALGANNTRLDVEITESVWLYKPTLSVIYIQKPGLIWTVIVMSYPSAEYRKDEIMCLVSSPIMFFCKRWHAVLMSYDMCVQSAFQPKQTELGLQQGQHLRWQLKWLQ